MPCGPLRVLVMGFLVILDAILDVKGGLSESVSKVGVTDKNVALGLVKNNVFL